MKSKPDNKSKTKAKPAKAPAKATKPAKAAPKPSKVAPKSVAKPSKPAKSAAKPAPAKKAVKAPVKAAVKPAVKAMAKKPAVRAAAPVKKAATKPAAKAVTKPATKPAAPKGKAKPATPVAGKSGAKKAAPSAKTSVTAKAAPVTTSKKVIAPVSNAVAAPEIAAKIDPSKTVAAKPRVSSRLAQLTVPSMASTPMVASTAAKATFGTASTVVAPLPMPYVPVKKNPKLANNWKTRTLEQLTDEDVVAMPDSEYMNDVQLAFFKLKLAQLKNDILTSAGETTEHLREETVVVPDPADRATIEEEHALELRTRDRERKLLKKIEQSIASIEAGDYGFCDETGEPIGVGRLLARPTATLSLEAQQRRELKQKMFGD